MPSNRYAPATSTTMPRTGAGGGNFKHHRDAGNAAPDRSKNLPFNDAVGGAAGAAGC